MAKDNGCHWNYTGSKARFYDKIKHLFPEDVHHKCLDVFTGGNSLGSMLPDKWDLTFNDKCSELISSHKRFTKAYDTSFLLKELDFISEEFKLSKENTDGYKGLVDFYNKHKSDVLLDYEFYLLACHSFSNYIRFNEDGEWNMPFGKRTFNRNMRKKLINWQERLSKKHNITWMSKDFRDIDFLDYSFLVIDPPYCKTVASYNERSGWSDQTTKDLLKKVDEFAESGGKFILFEEVISNGKNNTLIVDWMNKYKHLTLGDNSKGCNYQRKDKLTLEVCIYN